MLPPPSNIIELEQPSHRADPFFGLIANNPFGVYLVDASFKLIEVSLGAQKVFENVRPLYGRDFAEVMNIIWPEPFASEAISRFRHALETGESYQAPSFTNHRADIDVEEAYDWRIERVKLPDGRYGVVCYFYDLSERQRWEKALAESEKRFRTLVDTIPALIFVCDPDGQTTYAGPSLQAYAGLTDERLLEAGWLIVIHPDDQGRAKAAWTASRQTGSIHSDEYRFVDDAGDHRCFLVKVSPILEDDCIVQWVGSATDMQAVVDSRTALRQAKEQLEETVASRTAELHTTNALLQDEIKQREATLMALAQSQKLEALGQLTSGIAHDFNNIVAAISGGFAVIERRTSDPRIIEVARHGVHAAQRGAGLVKQLMAFTQRQVLMPKIVDVCDLIEDVKSLLQNAVGPQVKLSIECPMDIGFARVDQVMLDAALINLAINARDAMAGSGVIQISVRKMQSDAHDWPMSLTSSEAIAIAVADNGPGIEATILERVMEPFFTTKGPGRGSGMGLAMVHGFCKQSEGLFNIDSTVGKGTIATIYLPRVPETEARDDLIDPSPLSPEVQVREPINDVTLLIVDDDDDVRAVVCAQVEAFGCTTIAASSAAAAIILVDERAEIDAVMSDVAMPDMDGLALAAILRLIRPEMPILFMTGYTDRQLLEGENVLHKPFNTVGLEEAIRDLVSETSRNRASRGSAALTIPRE